MECPRVRRRLESAWNELVWEYEENDQVDLNFFFQEHFPEKKFEVRKKLEKFLLDQEDTLLQKDFCRLVLVANEVSILHDVHQQILILHENSKTSNQRYIQNLAFLKTVLRFLKNGLDGYEGNKFETTELFYGIDGIDDPLLKAIIDLNLKYNAKINSPKRPTKIQLLPIFQTKVIEINKQLEERILQVLQNLSYYIFAEKLDRKQVSLENICSNCTYLIRQTNL